MNNIQQDIQSQPRYEKALLDRISLIRFHSKFVDSSDPEHINPQHEYKSQNNSKTTIWLKGKVKFVKPH